MFVDFIMNGQGFGAVGEQLSNCRFDLGLLRPFIDQKNRKCVTVNTGQQKYNEETELYEPVFRKELVSDMVANGIPIPVANATSLRKDEWLMLDRVVLRAARQRLRAWSDLAAANSFGGFNGMSKMVLEHETLNDPGEAFVDMDGISEGRGDQPTYNLEGLPLPITHASFWFSSRRLAVSRNSGTPLDATMAESAARRVAETIEQTLIGTITGATYGVAADYDRRAPTVWGYTNFPDRVTKTDMTAPTSTNGTTILDDVLALRELLYANNFFGPFMMYVSTGYDAQLDNDFKTNSDKTVRQRLMEVDGIRDVRRLDYLTGDVVLLVQMTPDVARAVNGMDITTVQWESKGGMQLNFKVMAIQVPQLRADFDGNCGIAHGTV